MNRTLLWRDMRALSKELCETLSTDHGKQTASLSYCMGVVGTLNKKFDQPVAPISVHQGSTYPLTAFVLGGANAPEGALLLGTTKAKGFFKKKQSVYLTAKGALDQLMVVGCTGAGKTETLASLAANAASAKKGVFYMDGKGDNSLYAKTMAHLSQMGRVGDLRVINLMTGGREITDDKKISHTLDLFHGMDWQALSEWMQRVAPIARTPDDQKLAVQLFSELCPFVSRLLFQWSIHTGKRITPGMVRMALTHQGIRELVEVLNEEDRVAHKQLLKASQDPQGFECVALERLSEHLAPLSTSWAHVFDADRPEVGLADSFNEKHFVLVLAPAMEKSSLITQMVTTVINAALYHAINNLPFSGALDHLIILDEFNYTVNDQTLYALSRLRNRGCGLVWAAQNAPTQKQRLQWENDEHGAWYPPGVHIVMKQCSGHFEPDYYQAQATQHAAMANGAATLGNTDELREGEAIVYSGGEIHEVAMDYKNAKRMEKLFIPHANPLERMTLIPPGPMARPTRITSHRDRDKQAIVLFGRLSEFEENDLGRGYPPKLSWCQETLARMMGFAHWHEAQVRCAPEKE